MIGKPLRWLCALALIVGVSGTVLEAKVRKDRTVVVISLDGFPAYALDDARLPIPTIRKLAREGAIAASMQPINPTVTWPNHTTLVTGVAADQHGVAHLAGKGRAQRLWQVTAAMALNLVKFRKKFR